MKRVPVTQLKNRLSEFLRLVKRGETIEVLERSVPIARIEAVRPSPSNLDAHIERLVADGLVRPPRKKPDRAFLLQEPLPCTGDAVRAVLEERGER